MRLSLALWLVFYIVSTPIHLYSVQHNDDANFSADVISTLTIERYGNDAHDDDKHHERHPSEQHKIKLTPPERITPIQLFAVQSVIWTRFELSISFAQIFVFTGLSPPELPGSWRFLFRAALPVRAPSFLS